MRRFMLNHRSFGPVALLAVAATGLVAPRIYAQAPPLTLEEPAGMASPWDTQKMLLALNSQIEKLKPLFDRMHPKQWLDNGASPTYATQYVDAKSRLGDVINAVRNLSQRSDSISAALDTYFRMEALEINSRSLLECIQKYGERADAQELGALLGENFKNRQKFHQYLLDLSKQREEEFKVADAEAQRCRGIISAEPPARNGATSSKKK